jgi:hypothetical protein
LMQARSNRPAANSRRISSRVTSTVSTVPYIVTIPPVCRRAAAIAFESFRFFHRYLPSERPVFGPCRPWPSISSTPNLPRLIGKKDPAYEIVTAGSSTSNMQDATVGYLSLVRRTGPRTA